MKKIGILGGMGPQATIDLFQKIVTKTPASVDQDHIPIIINNCPQIPDRTKSILGTGDDAFESLLNGVHLLEDSGCEAVIIPCNTAHFYVPRLQQRTTVKILNMIALTLEKIKRMYPDVRKIGLLATTGTVLAGVYDNEFSDSDISLLKPTEEVQAEVMDAIYGEKGVKAGNYVDSAIKFSGIAQEMVHDGAELIIAGCTEIPLVLKNSSVPVIDPTSILAESAVSYACKNHEVINEVKNENRNSVRIQM